MKADFLDISSIASLQMYWSCSESKVESGASVHNQGRFQVFGGPPWYKELKHFTDLLQCITVAFWN